MTLDETLPYHIYPCGDHALTISFGNMVDETISKYVLNIFYKLTKRTIAGVTDVIPAYSSITVVYNVVAVKKVLPCTTAYNCMVRLLEGYINEDVPAQYDEGGLVRIPVCYEQQFAPDLFEMASRKNVQPQTIIQWHTAKTYRVFMLGFLPGFAYMGTVQDKLDTPRRSTPRTKVSAGSVGIAGRQTGIYPAESPGGWNIIGQTPLKMFDINRLQATLLKPGDNVQFYAIGVDEFDRIKAVQWASV